MFLIFIFYPGYVDSAITKQGHDCKEFLLRDDRKDAVKCLFYEVVSILKGLVFLQ